MHCVGIFQACVASLQDRLHRDDNAAINVLSLHNSMTWSRTRLKLVPSLAPWLLFSSFLPKVEFAQKEVTFLRDSRDNLFVVKGCCAVLGGFECLKKR